MITPAIHHASPPEGLFAFHPDFQLSRSKLTKRETEVVEGILLGLSNNEIAAELGISLQTLKGHLQAIGDKMGIDSKRYALRTRIVYLIALRAGKMPSQCELFASGLAGTIIPEVLTCKASSEGADRPRSMRVRCPR